MGVRQARAQMNGAVTEAEFQQAVVQYARLRNWMAFHPFDSRRSAPGYPDLTLVRAGRLVFAELKTETGRVSAAQVEWFDALDEVAKSCAHVEVHLFRPSDWPSIEDVLR